MTEQHAELRSLLAAIRRRWFRVVALRTVGRASAVAAAPVCAALAIDALAGLDGRALVLLAVVALVASLGLAAAVVWRMQRRPDDRHVARFIEERAAALPEGRCLDDALVSAVDVAESPDTYGRPAFLPLILANAVRCLRDIDAARIVPPASVRRSAVEAFAGTVFLIVAVSLAGPSLARAIETARVRYFPHSIELQVLPGDVRVAAGTPLRIRAVLRGGTTELTQLTPALVVAAAGDERTVEMVRTGGGYEFAFQSVDRTFKYSVAAGSARSSEYTVTALHAPRVLRIDVRYHYPSFSGLAARDEEDGGDIYAPAGTRVRLRIHTDKPVTEGSLALGSAGSALKKAGERLLEGELVLAKDDSYRVSVADTDGLRSNGQTEYFIRLMNDRPPDVRIVRPSGDQQITPLEEVAIEARADDDYGISTFDLVYSVSGGPERIVPFARVSGTDVQKIGSRLLHAEDLGVKPGDVITYYARARDVGRGKRPTETKSDIFFLEVKPFTEEFVAAQSQAMAGAAGAQIDSLIAAQKEIISATWNLERRSQAGRSAEDVKAVEQAQAELKVRAEQMISRGTRGRGRAPAPERPAPQFTPPQPRSSVADPISAAVAAMTRALQDLQTQKTKDAIPHEMAALNGLLQAQAEVRRRQVAQQNNAGGGGGGNRSGQDLSALFDKELQRQQRTAYENRSQVEERPDEQRTNESALDRIRDLARRQEDLNRRQRELAEAGLAAEEMKRQLEKLTREQIELRQQAEELSRQMAQQQGRQQQSRGSQQPSGSRSGQPQGQTAPSGRQGAQPQTGSTGDMKDAAEQMRSAASELRREDPSAASKSGERAAEQLRRVEQQMRGGSASATERAAGELQLEAQQIAEEQRRIAAEAERLQKSQGSAAGDAARRLASEKERLAGRVEELQRAAQQIANGTAKGAGQSAVAEAARELERERLGQRMRDTARQMRAAADSQKTGSADGEQQIARALDRVVDKFGAGASAETRQLSEQLNQTRDIRDRLNRLEQQMRDAEARNRAGDQGGRNAQNSKTSQTPQAGRQGREGQQGSRGSSGNGQQSGGELQRLQQEYEQELQRAREALGRLTEGQPQNGIGMSTPEREEFSRSAPGTEAFKQDRSGWESLRKALDSAMEKYEAAVSDRLSRKPTADRLSAGGSERVPDSYRRVVAKYYESLAKVKK